MDPQNGIVDIGNIFGNPGGKLFTEYKTLKNFKSLTPLFTTYLLLYWNRSSRVTRSNINFKSTEAVQTEMLHRLFTILDNI